MCVCVLFCIPILKEFCHIADNGIFLSFLIVVKNENINKAVRRKKKEVSIAQAIESCNESLACKGFQNSQVDQKGLSWMTDQEQCCMRWHIYD